ncbi:hypothetical protein D9M70_605360 [compost metagenome]
MLFAHEAAKACFHAPDSDQRAGGHAEAAFNAGEERRILLLHLLAAGNDRLTAALLHELVERQLEALLAAVGADRRLVVGDAGKGAVEHRRADAAA